MDLGIAIGNGEGLVKGGSFWGSLMECEFNKSFMIILSSFLVERYDRRIFKHAIALMKPTTRI